MGVEMEVVDGMHEGQNQGGRSHVRRSWYTLSLRGDTLMTPDHTVVQVRSSE